MNTHTGQVHHIGVMESYGSKGFTKRSIVLTDVSAKYPQYVSFDFTGDKCDLLEHYRVGDRVEIEFFLNGREYNGKYYNSLVGNKIRNLTVSNNGEETEDLAF